MTSTLIEAQTNQLLTPEACAGVQYVAELGVNDRPRIQLSPNGRKVAYVAETSDVVSNTDKEQLYVATLDSSSAQPSVPLAVNELISAIHWFPDNTHLAALLRSGGKIVLAEIDTSTSTQQIIWEADSDITDYSMDAAGNTIAVGVRTKSLPEPIRKLHDELKGYRLYIASIAHPQSPRRKIYILRRIGEANWKVSDPIELVSPLSGKTFRGIVDNHSLPVSISPDGHFLLLGNFESFSDVPKQSAWEQSPEVQNLLRGGIEGLVVSYLYDIDTGHTAMPLKSPYVLGGSWAPDSRSYVQLALAPVVSEWERVDLEKGTLNVHMTHLFSVDVDTGNVREVLNRAEEVPIAWTKAGDLIARDHPAGTLTTLRKTANEWKPIDTRRIWPEGAAPYDVFGSDGEHVVMQCQNASTAPNIVALDLKTGRTWTVVNLNPQIDRWVLPKTQVVLWTTSSGYRAKGLLLLPPDYNPQRRYPLVIEDGSVLYGGKFVCDSGVGHEPAFTRGILADAGIIYLTRYWPGTDDWKTNYYPKGYPGGIAEAAFQQDLVESAVKVLDQRKMIDPQKVGLIGFSRGGWYVEYMLAHTQLPIHAASAFDNVLYSMGEYWLLDNEETARQWDGMYGGPPYGKSLKNWLDYSISFNLDKIHTPLLMEVMGYGEKYEDAEAPPSNAAVHNEVFVGLSRLHKPVEYYYYPNEIHQPEHPQARIASMHRNVDWFRFWLQEYERPNPEDADQYKRWEHLRELRDTDLRGVVPTGANQSKTSSNSVR